MSNKRTPIVAPRASREFIAGDGKIGQDRTLNIPTTGEARVEGGEIEVVPADALAKKDKLDRLAFMEDELEIIVLPTSDKNSPPLVETHCNGRNQYLLRGKPQKVKRKFVEVLARAKLTTFRGETPLVNGEYQNLMHPTTGLVENFTVLRDPAGDRGRAWLEQVLAEA